jgi:16S rRNA (guanine(966)-N(2))-methyltransferase RsmD
MRIIAGSNKGKKLKSFDGFDVRPTSDRLREALFNILAQDIVGSSFLDLCCGTGAVGLEALSRGASSVVFVDKALSSIKICEYNLKSINKQAKIVNKDAILYLKSSTEKFDFIYFDPPYVFNEIESILKAILENKILTEKGVFIYEHNKDDKSKEIDGFTLFSSRKYGIAVVDFYKYKDNL